MNSSKQKEQDRVAQRVAEAVLQGATLMDLRGVCAEQMDGLYAYAYEFYQQGRLDDAEKFFHFLCIYDFYNAQYWTGLAAVHQLKQNYQKAIDLYAVAFAQSTGDYLPMFCSGQCQLALGKAGKAKACFEGVAESSTNEDLRQQAGIYLAALAQVQDEVSENSSE
ncbi:MAG: type III secretion system translocator chaperone SicA [Pseudomonas sp.]|jgi:type III secretion system low calcium response chaperone LcrH/SycD|uniref:type III secretion system translocator chaperone SicA n=1 Tax=Pseudomonas sp. TaxID=306 RepID=UPI002392B223|nr:type III secretion system translocator chaperone SicA [Pseudomonas sp.]MDE1196460.1 type III secretion system translocator chaperone SicA [Pseudomonas sp.]